jgi:hypothetical protein
MGANAAIKDAAELARVFGSYAGDNAEALCKVIDAWEGLMVERGVELVTDSVHSTRLVHATGFWQARVVRPLMLGFISAMMRMGQWAQHKAP